MKIYGYLYMGIYSFMKKPHYKRIPGIMACIWFTGLIGLNLIVLVGNLEVKVLEHVSSWVYAIILFIPIMVIGGTGRFAGTAKHTYAKNLLSRYQSIYGDRGLSLGSNYFKGPAGKGFLDVVNHNTMTIYDFKFGNAVMSNAQYLKYSNSFPGYSIQIIRP